MKRWLQILLEELTWLHFTRLVGVSVLIYEVVVDQVDRPSLMVVIGAMILGTETIFHKDKEKK